MAYFEILSSGCLYTYTAKIICSDKQNIHVKV